MNFSILPLGEREFKLSARRTPSSGLKATFSRMEKEKSLARKSAQALVSWISNLMLSRRD